MQSRLSIEIQNLLEQKKTKNMGYDSNSDSNLTTYSNNHSNTLKS